MPLCLDIPSGNVTALIAAINTANANGEENIINLEAGTYILTTIDNNTSGPNGLPVVSSRMSIVGVGAELTVIEKDTGAPVFRILHVAALGNLTLERVTLTGAGGFGNISQPLSGGAIQAFGPLTIANSNIVDNIAGPPHVGRGGGISSSSILTITGSTIERNIGGGIVGQTITVSDSIIAENNDTGQVDGGGISGNAVSVFNSTVTGNRVTGGSRGGGIAGSTVTIANSTITDNFADERAGAIFLPIQNPALTVANSTIARNSGPDGAIFVDGVASLTNSTIVDNSAPGIAGGQYSLQNTILARNFARFGGPDCFASVTSLGNNVIGDPSNCNISLLSSDFIGDPGLGPFIDDGTPGNGHFPLLDTSPAIDAGNNDVCLNDPLLATDQIGNPRVGICDIGAIEFSSVLTIALDVKPGSAENPVNPKSNGIIQVAILGTNGFDASTIDQASLRFGPGQALAEGRGHLEDVNGDGQLDLVLHFRTQDSGIQCGDTSVSITGQTVNGTPIQGSDSITTVGCKPVAADQKKK